MTEKTQKVNKMAAVFLILTVQNSPKNHKVLNSYKSDYSILGKAGE